MTRNAFSFSRTRWYRGSYHADLRQERRLRSIIFWKPDGRLSGIQDWPYHAPTGTAALFRPIATNVKAEKRFLSPSRAVWTRWAPSQGSPDGGQGLSARRHPEITTRAMRCGQLYLLLVMGKIRDARWNVRGRGGLKLTEQRHQRRVAAITRS